MHAYVSLELQLLVLALEAALYPTLLAAVIILIAQPRPKRVLGAYLAGGLVISVGAGCAIVYGLEHSGTLDNGSGSALGWTADLAIGGLALLLAVALARRADVRFAERRRARHPSKPPDPDADTKEPWTQRILARGSVPLVFAAGLAVNVPGAAYVIGLKDIAAANTAAGKAVVLILAFNAIMFMLAEIPLAGLVFAPEKTNALVERFNAWLSRSSRSIAIGVCTVLGAFLIARGIVNS
jgi:hypothetical protein